MIDDPFRQLRSRRSARPGCGDTSRPSARSPAFVGRVFATTSVPLSTGCFFSVHPVDVLGTEGESNPASLVVDASSAVLVYVAGGRTPVAGDDLICRFIGNRWVAESLSASVPPGVSIPACSCNAIPNVLHMTSSKPASNGRMFQNSVISYGATPPEYAALYLGDHCYLSPSSFVDQYGNSFRYHVDCSLADFTLARVYIISIFGSPYKDSIRYTWSFGAAGNTCQPFLLTNGRVYFGGDSSCVVTMSG